MNTNINQSGMSASVSFNLHKNRTAILALFLSGILSSFPVFAKTIVVSSLADSGPKTLRAALSAANNGDTIRVNAKGTIYLNSGPLTAERDVEILGPGNDRLALDGQMTTLVFQVASNATVSLENLTLSHGYNTFNSSGGAVQNLGGLIMLRCVVRDSICEFGDGGGIYNQGNLGLFQCTISNNLAVYGGGIADQGDLLIVDGSTINANRSMVPGGSGGGGISKVTGSAFLTNVTISGNTAYDGNGGGILAGAPVHLENCTVVSNAAIGVIPATSFGRGGGIAVIGSGNQVEIRNTIIAGNSANIVLSTGTVSIGPDAWGALLSQGWNLIQSPTDAVITGDLTGNLLGVDPRTGPLTNNGGPTLTHSLLPGSPAIDAASPFVFPRTDQRGAIRPQDGNDDNVAIADIGAYENSDQKIKKARGQSNSPFVSLQR